MSYYVRHRPRYPVGLIPFLRHEIQLTPEWVVVDVGSGTGILSELFLENGNVTYGVEPNREMREAGENLSTRFSQFHSINGTAEAIPLSDGIADIITAGQAFHWFDPLLARQQFQRVGKPGAWSLLVWNHRREEGPFSQGYSKLLERFSTDYHQVVERSASLAGLNKIRQFFSPGEFCEATLPNFQEFDFEGLSGRLLSSSYVPLEGQPDHAPMMAELRALFDREARGGVVRMDYDCRVYFGRL